MAIGRRRPARTISETTTPITSGITQAISTAAPGVISPQATPTAAQPIAPTGTTPGLAAVGQEQQELVTPSVEAGYMTPITPGVGAGVTPPGAADQAGDMMPIAPEAPAAIPGVGELVSQFQEQGEAARAANEARYAQGLGIHEQLVGDFGAGGTMEAAAMQRYGQQKQTDIAAQMQQAVSSGMFGTTRPSTYGAAYEQQVGTPYKLGLAEAMAQRKAEAMRGQAGFIERREDIPPDPALMASLVQTASARPEEDAAATGAGTVGAGTTGTGTGTAGAPGQTSIWGSGQTGAITVRQYEAEAKRQEQSAIYTAHAEAYKAQIESYKKAAEQHEPGSAYNAHFIKLMEGAKKSLKEAEGNMEKYGEGAAKISSDQFANREAEEHSRYYSEEEKKRLVAEAQRTRQWHAQVAADTEARAASRASQAESKRRLDAFMAK